MLERRHIDQVRNKPSCLSPAAVPVLPSKVYVPSASGRTPSRYGEPEELWEPPVAPVADGPVAYPVVPEFLGVGTSEQPTSAPGTPAVETRALPVARAIPVVTGASPVVTICQSPLRRSARLKTHSSALKGFVSERLLCARVSTSSIFFFVAFY